MLHVEYEDLDTIEKSGDKELALIYLLNMLHQEKIGIHRAYEICEEYGLFERSAQEVEQDYIDNV